MMDKMPETKKICFVVMPFSETTKEHTKEYWTKHFEDFLQPLIEEHPELEAVRSKPLRQEILKDIVTHLVTCAIVVADITDLNPNVFWELGVRQSFKHGTVVIAEEGTKAPFDIFAKSILFYYPRNHVENAKFTRDFKDALKDCVENPTRPDSHVLDTISGRGTMFEIFRRDEAIRRLDALLMEIDWNDYVAREIYEKVDSNTAQKKTVTTLLRFATSSLELLLTERYLDVDSSFYDRAMTYYANCRLRNEVLSRWATEFEQATKKLLELREDITTEHQNFRSKVQKVRSDLVSKIC
jgi:hypothetical protein